MAAEIDPLEPTALHGQPLERVVVATPPSEAAALRIVSGVEFLAGYSRLHASYPPEMLERRVAPSLMLGQFCYYVDPRGIPLAFCNWAWLNARVLGEALATGRDLRVDEFSCGDSPLFYEFLAPFGHCRAVARDLRSLSIFKGRCIPSVRGEVRDGGPIVPRLHHFQF